MTADRLALALEDAATSLETVAKNAGQPYDTDGYENLLEHHDQVRGYAASRASAARTALAEHLSQAPAEGDGLEAWRETIHEAALAIGGFGAYFLGASGRQSAGAEMRSFYAEQHQKAKDTVNALMDLRDEMGDAA